MDRSDYIERRLMTHILAIVEARRTLWPLLPVAIEPVQRARPGI
jgi:hypothetical protein